MPMCVSCWRHVRLCETLFLLLNFPPTLYLTHTLFFSPLTIILARPPLPPPKPSLVTANHPQLSSSPSSQICLIALCIEPPPHTFIVRMNCNVNPALYHTPIVSDYCNVSLTPIILTKSIQHIFSRISTGCLIICLSFIKSYVK